VFAHACKLGLEGIVSKRRDSPYRSALDQIKEPGSRLRCGVRPSITVPQREFANQRALIQYAEKNGLAYLWHGTPAFAKRQRTMRPERYEIVRGTDQPWGATCDAAREDDPYKRSGRLMLRSARQWRSSASDCVP
jgi:hypothetical protein